MPEEQVEVTSQIRRLSIDDRDLARDLFTLLTEVFGETSKPLSDAYLDALLRRESFVAIAAIADGTVVGGLTAHILPMTRSECAEVFVYDVAVSAHYQRQGIGRELINALSRDVARNAEIFVAADTEDSHALDFYRGLGGVAAPVTMFTFAPTT